MSESQGHAGKSARCTRLDLKRWAEGPERVVCHERRMSYLRRATVREMKEGPSGSVIEALHGSVLTPLVGRDDEIDLLLRRWARVKAGDG
jgi:hypothetical protein